MVLLATKQRKSLWNGNWAFIGKYAIMETTIMKWEIIGKRKKFFFLPCYIAWIDLDIPLFVGIICVQQSFSRFYHIVILIEYHLRVDAAKWLFRCRMGGGFFFFFGFYINFYSWYREKAYLASKINYLYWEYY